MVLCGLLAVGLLIAACGGGNGTPTETPSVTETPVEEEGVMAFAIRSDAFDADQPIPTRFTCDGDDVSPALSWSDVPDGTQSLALIMDDPDAPRGVFTHWVLFNLPAGARSLPEGVAKTERPESGGIQGRTDFGDIGSKNYLCAFSGRCQQEHFFRGNSTIHKQFRAMSRGKNLTPAFSLQSEDHRSQLLDDSCIERQLRLFEEQHGIAFQKRPEKSQEPEGAI